MMSIFIVYECKHNAVSPRIEPCGPLRISFHRTFCDRPLTYDLIHLSGIPVMYVGGFELIQESGIGYGIKGCTEVKSQDSYSFSSRFGFKPIINALSFYVTKTVLVGPKWFWSDQIDLDFTLMIWSRPK